VSSLIAERAFEHLEGPIVRVATPDVPIPFAPVLERTVLPSAERIRAACDELLAY
jgi:2-oxoisovalerate dehydrogenase E1 component beta subunit